MKKQKEKEKKMKEENEELQQQIQREKVQKEESESIFHHDDPKITDFYQFLMGKTDDKKHLQHFKTSLYDEKSTEHVEILFVIYSTEFYILKNNNQQQQNSSRRRRRS